MIIVDGIKRKVLSSYGYDHSVGGYVKEVDMDGTARKVVKRGKVWKLWTNKDRVQPLMNF